jgi:hypothetical protein
VAKKHKSIGKILRSLSGKKKSGKMKRMQSLFTVQAGSGGTKKRKKTRLY